MKHKQLMFFIQVLYNLIKHTGLRKTLVFIIILGEYGGLQQILISRGVQVSLRSVRDFLEEHVGPFTKRDFPVQHV